MTLQLPTCASHVALSWVSFLRASCKIHLLFNSCSIFHQLNTKPNIIKSHKIQRTKLKQIQHFLSWNKANIKHSCKSQLYNCILFTGPTTTLFKKKKFKNGYHSTIYTFKNYFAIVFSIFSFQ